MLGTILALASTTSKSLPPVQPFDDPLAGKGIQRTVRKLAESGPKKRNKVVIVYYGQSITDRAPWAQQVTDYLKKKYPYADIDARNLAMAGFSSYYLKMPAEQDIYPLNPDLVILHDYGADNDYEELVKAIRSRTTAEVLVQTDHATFWPRPEPKNGVRKAWLDWEMNMVRLPAIAARYGCGIAPIRREWVRYLKTNALEPQTLLIADHQHLNAEGNRVMADIIKQCFVLRKDERLDDSVRDVTVGKDVNWKNGRLSLPFSGNRVAVVVDPEMTASPIADVKIDGQSPAGFKYAYAFTRPEPRAWFGPTCLARVDHDAALVPEDWQIVVDRSEDEGKRYHYKVMGSVTGPDGDGWSDRSFISKSGRVRIEPEWWYRTDAVPEGTTIKWSSYPLYADELRLQKPIDSTRESLVVLAQQLTNGRHHLEIVSRNGRPLPISAIRIYRPAVGRESGGATVSKKHGSRSKG